MAPLIIVLGMTAVARTLGLVGMAAFDTWPEALRLGLAGLFAFAGATHFTGMRHDYHAMLPPPFQGRMWVIYATGVLELAGAVGLWWPGLETTSALGLALLLVAMFPANVHAARRGIPFRGTPPTDLRVRAAVQLALVLALWWSSPAR